MQKWLPIGALSLAMVIWASSFIAMKVAVDHLSPLTVVFGRMVIASALFALFYRRIRNVLYRPGDWKYIGLMALFEPCLYFVFEGYALRYTAASQAGMITATLPLITAVAARFLLDERITRKTLVGFVLAFGGVIWLTLAGKPSMNAPHPVLGNLLEVCAMLCAAGYFISLKRLSARYNPWFLTAMQSFAGAIFFLPTLLLQDAGALAFVPAGIWWSIFYLGAVVTVGAYGLYNYGVSKVPVSRASAYINLIPVLAVIMGWLFLGETFQPMQYAASGVVFLGVFLSQG